MEDSTRTSDKRIAEGLNYGSKTAKRVGWEAWEFAVEAPHLVRVTNASCGCEKDDHSYLVGVEDRDGLLVASECECPADKYNEGYDCKQEVALATVGGSVVLQAAVDCPTPTVDTGRTTTQKLEDKLRADGGAVTRGSTMDFTVLNKTEHSECNCDDLPDKFPCANCYIKGRKTFRRKANSQVYQSLKPLFHQYEQGDALYK